MNFKEIYSYYLREDVQEALLEIAKDREVVGVFKNGGYGSRPNTLIYSKDILEMVKSGVIEFHGSIERWSQPMALKSENYEKLRIGWDLILDLDCELIEHGKIAAKTFIWGIKKHGIKNFSVKFTGGTGFHIGVPWESFPKTIDYKPIVKQYPELAKKIVFYLKEFVRERLEEEFLKKYSLEELAEQVNKPLGKILIEDSLNPFEIVEVDPILISERHLFRLPYSLHRKNFLVSMPLKIERIEDFKKEQAKPDKIKIKEKFFGFEAEKNEAEALFIEAIDWWIKHKKEVKVKEKKKKRVYFGYVKPEYFPPCIKTILQGIPDGRKRSVFILINFLRSLKWKWEDIEKTILEWNEKNKPPLKENYIRSQLRWHKNQKKKILPPNCLSEGWYTDFDVCKQDKICKEIKNPVNYPFKKMGKRKKKNF